MGDYTEPTKAIIFDIDGTLADVDHRRHLVEGKKKDFNAFYDAMVDDPVKSEIRGLCNMYSMNTWHIIICTGRPESHRPQTEKWLKDNCILHDELRMRPMDRRYDPDFEVKQSMLDDIKAVREVCLAVDDRDQVVEMWRRNGITCLQCAPGNF